MELKHNEHSCVLQHGVLVPFQSHIPYIKRLDMVICGGMEESKSFYVGLSPMTLTPSYTLPWEVKIISMFKIGLVGPQ